MSNPAGNENHDASKSTIVDPPQSFGSILLRIGPGLIIAGSIVGSGELIATTKVGAETGFWLMWLIIIGCVIKVFAQVEFGRYTVTHAQTPLQALNSVPGPRFRVNWILWYWALMTCLIVSQQGGIVGSIGQALAISIPITEKGRNHNQAADQLVQAKVQRAVLQQRDETDPRLAELDETINTLSQREDERTTKDSYRAPIDTYLWATIVAIVTSLILLVGRYGFIQLFATIMVVGFTVFTVLTVILLQTKPDWAVTGAEFGRGLQFRLPPAGESLSRSPLATALGAFGIIGVGASELIMYPYWCLEKGYARFTGPRDGSESWTYRARGWMRVMRVDAWASMIIYTFATLAFFLLGAAVLGRVKLNPGGGEMVRTLAQMYVPVFGEHAPQIFLIGAFAVLYSTFFVAAAGNSRMVSDGFGMFGFHDGSERTRMRWARVIGVVWPIMALLMFLSVKVVTGNDAPAQMVLLSGVAQAIMLPMLGIAALYFRYRRCDENLRPGRLWDVLLVWSVVGLLIAGSWAAVSNLQKFMTQFLMY